MVLPDEANIKFMPLRTLRKMATYKYSMHFDMKKFYYQFALPGSVSTFFPFRVNGVTYEMTRLPMGLKSACALAQTVIEFLVSQAALDDVVWDAYIDNVKIASNKEANLQETARRFVEFCRKYNVTIGEVMDSRKDHWITHRGVAFSHENGTVKVGEKLIAKFLKREPETNSTSLSWEQWRSASGMLSHAMQILGIEPASCYAFQQWVCKNESKEARHMPLSPISAAAFANWHKVRSQVLKNSPKLVRRPPESHILLFTDACEHGLAAVLSELYKTPRTVSKRVAEKKHINLLEAEALLLGLRTFREFLTGKTFDYFFQTTLPWRTARSNSGQKLSHSTYSCRNSQQH